MKYLFLSLCLLVLGCTEFSTRYVNIENDKIRPIAFICDPPEAMPGDTVDVRVFASFPNGMPDISWTVALDYGVDLYGNETVERHIVPLSDLHAVNLDDSLGIHFRFVVPDSTLLFSTQLKGLLARNAASFGGMSVADLDSFLRASPPGLLPFPGYLVDQFAANIKLRGHMVQNITLDITKEVTVRYTGKFNPANASKNPSIRWIKWIAVQKNKMTSPDSIRNYPFTERYLYPPESISVNLKDTPLVIDQNVSYFLCADSGKGGNTPWLETYSYYSTRDTVLKEDTSLLEYDWLYTNKDYTSSMKKDSLILFPNGQDMPMVSVLPPVDTRMRHFKFYVAIRTYRTNDPKLSCGGAYQSVEGEFQYTDAYSRYHRQ